MARSTAIVWFRRDLRVHDHPALAEALAEHHVVVPVFVLDPVLLAGRFRSAPRTWYMLECLKALDGELRERGGRLVIRKGAAERELATLAYETGARVVYASGDVTGYGRSLESRVGDRLALELRPGPWIADLPDLLTQQGRPYTTFGPFLKRWRAQPRRDQHPAPSQLEVPSMQYGRIPALASLGFPEPRLQEWPEAGEAAAVRDMESWLRSGADRYAEVRDLPAERSSRLSQHLRWGTLSALRLEQRVAARGLTDYRAELAWRDFYAAIQLHFPRTAREELQERYRGTLDWADDDEGHFDAWAEGRTGYPFVDAGMRQLRATGFVHNRVRMVVASFLTKDLHLDWRLGEAEFMRHLIDGDVGSNNGGWQWVASVGADPKPYFQRLFNPMTQQERFDPEGEYVRRWVPELERVPIAKLSRPWTMTGEEQARSRCHIGRDYPEPIVDHAIERKRAIERYRAVTAG